MDKCYLKNNHDEDVMEKHRSKNMMRTLWRNVIAKIILNINIRSVLSFSRDVVWSVVMKLSGPRAFRSVMTTASQLS
jgi:DNA-binding transcriptional ArsR family regulator